MSTSDPVGGVNVRAGRAIQIVHRSFRDPSLRITEIARALHISPTHLSRLIKKETGIGFRALCIRLRLTEGKRHLLDPTLSVKEVASLVGFNSTSNFDRDFRRLYGCSPTQWRSQEFQMNGERSGTRTHETSINRTEHQPFVVAAHGETTLRSHSLDYTRALTARRRRSGGTTDDGTT